MAVRADDVDLERDRDLVQRYQAGDPDAFDDLYRRYFDRLHGFCQRRVGDRHVAEELAQEAFVRALRAMPTFAGERRFYPWMTVIAQRLCIDHHRRRARVEPAAVIDLGAVEPDHDALFLAVDTDHLSQALGRLAPRHREVLDLREREGLTYVEIGERMSVPVSTVEALLHRARKALRREFLAVSGGNRVWGLPVLGVFASRMASFRARVGDRAAEMATLVAPAAVAAVTAAVVLIPGGSAGPVKIDAATSNVVAPTEGAGDEVEAASVAAATETPRHAPVADAPAAVEPAPEPQPTVDTPAAEVWIGPGADSAKDHAGDMPVNDEVGPVTAGANPLLLVEDLVHDPFGFVPTGKAAR